MRIDHYGVRRMPDGRVRLRFRLARLPWLWQTVLLSPDQAREVGRTLAEVGERAR
jgi:hypothetical protein